MLNTEQEPITIEKAIAYLKKEGINLTNQEAQVILDLMQTKKAGCQLFAELL